ncbi:MAG: PTS mannose/fructose/sorbose transporter subunit IIC [Erysipelotrichaceae bacterium]|nr:PTS mannose/fructose/sorbose transporter subunit IIC [Erysipelotrichaceae bacterium]
MNFTTGLLIVLVAFLAGIEGILDEFQFHQPLVACTLIGLVSNQLEAGIILGGTLQMIALGWANIGASVAPDVTLASVASSIFLVLSGKGVDSIYVAIAIAIPLSMFGVKLTHMVRTVSVSIVHRMDDAAEDADFGKIQRWHLVAVCLQGLRVALPAAILLLIPTSSVNQFMNMIPTWLLEGLCIGGGMIVAIGYAIVINVMVNKEIWPFFVLGFVLAMMTQFTLLALVLIAIAFMTLYLSITTKNKKNTSSEDPLDDILNDY